MNQNILKLDTEILSNIVNDMILAKFNENNQLIKNIKNHVIFESNVERSIPQVQDKINIINSYDNTTEEIQNDYHVEEDKNNIEINNDVKEYIEESIKQCPTKIQIVKLCVISILLIVIICFILWKYVNNKYTYVFMVITGAIILCSDYIIYSKNWITIL
jgi:hypothetical protein